MIQFSFFLQIVLELKVKMQENQVHVKDAQINKSALQANLKALIQVSYIFLWGEWVRG